MFSPGPAGDIWNAEEERLGEYNMATVPDQTAGAGADSV